MKHIAFHAFIVEGELECSMHVHACCMILYNENLMVLEVHDMTSPEVCI